MVYLNPKALPDFLPQDLYKVQLARVTIVLLVGTVSPLIDWFDHYIVNSLVNLECLLPYFYYPC